MGARNQTLVLCKNTHILKSLFSPSETGSHYVDQAGLELLEITDNLPPPQDFNLLKEVSFDL